MEQKITTLEEKFSHLEYTIETLDKMVFEQMQKINELELMIKHLSKRLNDKQNNDDNSIDNPPPHY